MRTLPLLLAAVVLLLACLFRYEVQVLPSSSQVVVLDRWQGVVTRRDLPEDIESDSGYTLPAPPWEKGKVETYPGTGTPWVALVGGFIAGVAVGGLAGWRRVKPVPGGV